MKLKKLPKNFYNKKTLLVAKKLIGKYIVRKINNKIIIGEIIETEAYFGFNDDASHASKGITKRNKPMFMQGGIGYIYLIYGMYYCFNIVTEGKNFPAAVLIRSVRTKNKTINGPGKLCNYFLIDKSLNNCKLNSDKLFIAENQEKNKKTLKINKSTRININYAQKTKNKPWRFYID